MPDNDYDGKVKQSEYSNMQIKVGDIVAIRGDKRVTYSRQYPEGRCVYDYSQLVDGKYVKHTGTGEIWTGRVDKIRGEAVLIGGGYFGMEICEVMWCGSSRCEMSELKC